METTIKDLSQNMKALQIHIDNIKQEKEKIEQTKQQMETEREEEKKIVQEALDAAIDEKKNIQKRWENDFEKLRNVNTDREQQMFNDFEWKLREVEQTCKKRLEEKDKKTEERIREKQKEMESKMKMVEEQMGKVEHLKSCETELNQLRTLTADQQKSLKVMNRHTDELEQKETQLKEELAKMQKALDKEKTHLIVLKNKHEKELSDKERQLQIRLEQQRNEVAVQWEQKLRQECARLKQELDQMHNEEKHLAIELVKVQKEQEYLTVKKEWESKLESCLEEIDALKHLLETKDDKHQSEMDRLRTNTDHDAMQLRRALDKADLSYHEKMEKMSENHETEIGKVGKGAVLVLANVLLFSERINEEADRRIRDMESNYQMQISSMRATLELVKEQMERDTEDRLQQLRIDHKRELGILLTRQVHLRGYFSI